MENLKEDIIASLKFISYALDNAESLFSSDKVEAAGGILRTASVELVSLTRKVDLYGQEGKS